MLGTGVRHGPAPAWQQEELDEADRAQRQAGAALFKHLGGCFCLGKLSAQDFCIALWHCQQAGVRGAQFSRYACAPGLHTGSYQRHLDVVMPRVEHQYSIQVMGNVRRRQLRGQKTIVAKAFWESVGAEFAADPTRVGVSPEAPMPRSYNEHELVVRARAAGQPLPVPLVMYIDAVRVTSALGGRSESLIGFWLYTWTTLKRHLLLGLRKTLLCRCGCRGWCTLYTIFVYISYGLRALRSGERLPLRHDGSPLDAEALQRRAENRFLPCTGILDMLKVDLGELAGTLGLQPWSSHYAPCPVCMTPLDTLHLGYEQCSLRALVWPEQGDGEYEAQCAACELQVFLRDSSRKGAASFRAVSPINPVPAVVVSRSSEMFPASVFSRVTGWSPLSVCLT